MATLGVDDLRDCVEVELFGAVVGPAVVTQAEFGADRGPVRRSREDLGDALGHQAASAGRVEFPAAAGQAEASGFEGFDVLRGLQVGD
jgi:hypothetical protein